MRIQKEHEIQNFEDLRIKKIELQKKARKKEKRLRKKIEKLSSNASVPVVYDELLSEFKLQNGLMQMLPYILKYGGQLKSIGAFDKIRNTPWKRFAIMVLGSFGAGLYTYYHLSKKEENKEDIQNKEKETVKEEQTKQKKQKPDLFI